MLLSLNFNFILISLILNDIIGQLVFIVIITLAASEMALGLSILIVYYRFRGDILVNLICLLKG